MAMPSQKAVATIKTVKTLVITLRLLLIWMCDWARVLPLVRRIEQCFQIFEINLIPLKSLNNWTGNVGQLAVQVAYKISFKIQTPNEQMRPKYKIPGIVFKNLSCCLYLEISFNFWIEQWTIIHMIFSVDWIKKQKPLRVLPAAHHTPADFLSGDLRFFIADKKSASVRCFPTSHDKVGGKLNMFDFQTSWRILSASVWWSPTFCRRQIYAVTNGKGLFPSRGIYCQNPTCVT